MKFLSLLIAVLLLSVAGCIEANRPYADVSGDTSKDVLADSTAAEDTTTVDDTTEECEIISTDPRVYDGARCKCAGYCEIYPEQSRCQQQPDSWGCKEVFTLQHSTSAQMAEACWDLCD